MSARERAAEPGGRDPTLSELARLTLLGGLVVLAVAIATLVLWRGRDVLLLLFLAYTFAAAIRPGVESLARFRVPRFVAILAHLLVLAGIVALLLWLFVPVALEQTQTALRDAPRGGAEEGLFESARQQALVALKEKLAGVAKPDAALETLVGTLSVLAGFAFTLAAAVYWVAERDRLVGLVLAVVPHEKRTTVRDAWLLIDLKLGAVMRTKLLLVVMTSTVLSFAFWIIGLPYFLLVGTFAGLVEVLPVIGPLLAGLAAIGVGYSVSWQLALAAGVVVYGLRLVQDYVVNPRLFGRAVHLPPLAVLLAVSALALLLGPLWVPLAVPLTAVLATLLEVLVWKQDPAEKLVPTVLPLGEETVEERRRRPWQRRPRLAREGHSG